MLAYLFWHRRAAGVAGEDYERAVVSFHRSLARRPPVGLRGSIALRTEALPWLAAETDRGGATPEPAYEDWYLVEDYAALGVLAEAAVGRGHRSAHDEAARLYGEGAAGLYALLEGDRQAACAGAVAVWVARAPGSAEPLLGELLGDGAQRGRASLWRRQLVLGPAPEFCMLAAEAPAGVSARRLPAGWTARTVAREPLAAGWGAVR